ncbi:hypothetical protein EON65_47700 [archaeon]|nr:MAG: hypothetical protein EON65_47700 [archaeon]
MTPRLIIVKEKKATSAKRKAERMANSVVPPSPYGGDDELLQSNMCVVQVSGIGEAWMEYR